MTLPHHDIDKAKEYLRHLIVKHHVNIIAIGNGTASKETEIVVADLLKEIDSQVYYTIVNEAGASVYSAFSPWQRGVSNLTLPKECNIHCQKAPGSTGGAGKNDPAIGVGQYQHDVNQKRMAETLQGVVEDCVNSVGWISLPPHHHCFNMFPE